MKMANEKKEEGLAVQGPNALGPAPTYVPKSRRGFEDTVQTDLTIPRLALAQALSPQVTEGDPRRIEGLKAGDLFNSVTGQNYGREVRVQLLRKMPLRAMEFRSIDEGGGVIDPNVPLNDERLRWGNTGDKRKDKPQATLFRDFLAVILPQREIIALSFKSSGIKAAKDLWGLATMSGRDCFAVVVKISTGVKLDPKPHQIFKVELESWASEQDIKLGEDQYEAVKVISAEKIHHGDDGDLDDFDPDQYEREARGGRADM
jgi:hypothetical protein